MAIGLNQTLLNRYRIDAFIASGGMGAVYRVWDEQRNVSLALKVLHDDLVDDPALVKSFMREARALERLRHPNIVPFYGAKESQDRVFLLAHFINGPTLKRILKATKFSILDSLTVLKALCAALGFAHRNNVVHCDVKPGNIMVDSGGNLYLTDFGIARHAESTRTTFGGAVGTAYYMAPEQFLEEQVTAATDVYALGVLLFEMLAGKKPFTGAEVGGDTDRTTRRQRIIHAHLKLPTPDPRSINPSIPENLAIVVLKALAKRPQDRYQSTTEFFSMVCEATGIAVEAVPDRLDLPPELKEDKFIEPGLPDQLENANKPGWLSLKTGMITVMVVVGSLVILFASMSVGRNRGNSVVTPKTQRDEDIVIETATSTVPITKTIESPRETITVSVKPTTTVSPRATKTKFPTSTTRATAEISPTPRIYFPLPSCAPSRVYLGDVGIIIAEGGNFIRSEPDTHPSDNIIGNADQGEYVNVVGGPECNYGWVLWEIVSSTGERGWIAETDGTSFWIDPLTRKNVCTGAQSSTLDVGMNAYVSTFSDAANRVRESPTIGAKVLGTINPGELIDVIDGPVCANGYVWWKVRSRFGLNGWTIEGSGYDRWVIPEK